MAQSLRLISRAIVFRLYFSASSVLILVVLSRYLGLEEFGRYAWLVSISFLISGLSQTGGNHLVVRETSRSSGRRAPVQILLRTMMISAATLGVLTVAALLLADDLTVPLLPLALLAAGNLTLVLLGASTRGMGLIQKGQIPDLVLRPTLFLVFLGLAVLSGRLLQAEGIVYLQIAAYGAVVLVAGFFFVSGLAGQIQADAQPLEKDWLGSFFRLGLISWLAVGNAQLLVILTGALASYAEVGLYRIAAQAVLIMGLGLAAIEAVQAPAYARCYKADDHYGLHDLLQQSCRIGVLISATVMVFLVVLGRPLLVVLFGKGFSAAFPALCVLAGAQLFNAMTGNVGILMIAAKRERKLILGNAAALSVTLLTAWLFIPQYGALAAAVASGLGLTVRNLLNMWFCWQAFGILAVPFAPYLPPITDRETS